MIDKNTVFQFIKSQDLCILSTASKSGKTESAVMAFAVDDNFVIYMSTENTTRKFKNILKNNFVSVIVGGLKSDPSVQLDGTTIILTDTEIAAAKDFMLSLHPELKDYFNTPNSMFFTVTPSWLRYSDFSQNPPEVIELSQF
ncbi:MAG: pyridoxamine 5'-phosphate oxidase family protein [Candidatus Shapirobacteria bacterium]|jgi:general stress protein 26